MGPVLVVAAALVCLALQAQRYDSQGKRDPFANPLRLDQRAREPEVVWPPPPDQRPPGLSGLLVSEVSVAGTATNGIEEIVILKGVDGYTYLARPGSRLYDGRLLEVRGDEFVFIRETVNTRGDRREQEVVKRFYTDQQGEK